MKKAAAALLALALAGCANSIYRPVGTLQANPERYTVVLDAAYAPGAQAQLADCVFDQFSAFRSYALMQAAARQQLRAGARRVDLVESGAEFLVADVRDGGRLVIYRSRYDGIATGALDETQERAKTCLTRIG